MKILKSSAAISLLMMVGCAVPPEPPVQHFVAQGIVASIWEQERGVFYTTFRHDNGETTVLQCDSVPPFWVGEHVRITYHKSILATEITVEKAVQLP